MFRKAAASRDDHMRKQRPLLVCLILTFTLLLLVGVGRGGNVNATPPLAKPPTSTPANTPIPSPTPGPAPNVGSTELSQGWALQSANNVADTGATISQVGYPNVASWYPISVPSTVLAGL